MRAATGGIRAAFWLFWVVSNSAQSSHAAQDFRLFTEEIRDAEENKMARYVLLADDKRFTFIPPARWNVKADRTKRTITLLPQDLKAGVTMRFNQEPGGGTPELKTAELRERIQERYPGAKFTREFECASDGQTGLAFDLIRLVEKNTKAGMRIVFVPYDGGMVEFELTTAAAKLADYHVSFSRLLYSFRIAPAAGKK
jgi:hypothetical protein